MTSKVSFGLYVHVQQFIVTISLLFAMVSVYCKCAWIQWVNLQALCGYSV